MIKWYIESLFLWTIITAVLILAMWELRIIDADSILDKPSGVITLFCASLVVAAIPLLRIMLAVGSVLCILDKYMDDKA